MCWTNPIPDLFSLHIPPLLKTKHKSAVNRQLAFDDFNQSCGCILPPAANGAFSLGGSN